MQDRRPIEIQHANIVQCQNKPQDEQWQFSMQNNTGASTEIILQKL